MHKIACVFVAIVVAAGVSLQPTNKQQQHKLLATSTHGKKRVRRNETVAVSLRQQQNQLQAMQNTTATE